MEADVLRAIAGIGVFPALSLLIFVAFFSIMLAWTARLDRPRLIELAQIPLDLVDERDAEANPTERSAVADGDRS